MRGTQIRRVCTAVAAIGLLGAGEAVADPLPPFPVQPGDVPWPVDAWAEAPLPEGAADEVNALIADAMTRGPGDVMGETRAIVIIHRGRLVAEAYRDGFAPETKQVSWSMAKSITHALVGRAVEEGLIADMDAPMPTHWPAGDPRSRISWRDWLEMTDGLAYREIGVDDVLENDVSLMMYGPGRFDVVAHVAQFPLIHTPGTHFNYSTAGLHLVGWALGQVQADCTGGTSCTPDPKRLSAWARQTLFIPLGIDAVIEFDAAGTFLGGSLVWASPRDFARFGLLYLRGGVWQGDWLLPDGWAEWARTGAGEDDGNVYGAGFWIAEPPGTASMVSHAPDTGPYDAFSAQGHEGQIIWIVPSRDLVIVRTGLMTNAQENWKALMNWCQAVAQAFDPVN